MAPARTGTVDRVDPENAASTEFPFEQDPLDMWGRSHQQKSPTPRGTPGHPMDQQTRYPAVRWQDG
ncbi:hypothetical protein HEK131_09800 [Streptomyces seoulensis]|nr:hypothetical protein HEK131_09800 [Streptomyces seoulensis]